MADGKWVMTEEDARRVDLSFSGSARQDLRSLPNYGQHRAVDDREGAASAVDKCEGGASAVDKCEGAAEEKCAFCGSADLQSGFGGCGEGFGYRSFICRACGGTTDLVYKDEAGKFFK